jgi:hypothetical protein
MSQQNDKALPKIDRAGGHSSRLDWLSLVGLLPSRAQLRFASYQHYTDPEIEEHAS